MVEFAEEDPTDPHDFQANHQGESWGFLVQQRVEVSGLKDTTRLKSGRIDSPTNFTQKLPDIAREVAKIPWLSQLIEEVRSGKKSAIIEVTSGGILITAALVAGYEFGISKGRDIRVLGRLLDKFHRDQNPKI